MDENEWTDAETLSLLEGIELHSDDWIKVSFDRIRLVKHPLCDARISVDLCEYVEMFKI